MNDNSFIITEDGAGRLTRLAHPQDPYDMNWVAGDTPWGTVTVPQWPQEYADWGVPQKPYALKVAVERATTAEGRLRERYTFSNPSDFEICTLAGDIGIYTPFNDSYESAATCKAQRCHAHVWCGGQVSFVCALRMGGTPPHLGLALTQGALIGYSIRRDPQKGSNDRGDIILHPAPMWIAPGETAAVEWELFWFESRAQFDEILQSTGSIHISASQFIAFQGETVDIASNAEPARMQARADAPGERLVAFRRAGRAAHAALLTLPPFDELLQKRVHFIARNQQCHNAASPLCGAYLIYDNEEKRPYYAHTHDHNAGRERVGMGVLMARYLRTHEDAALYLSLEAYLQFVLRELFDDESGTVFNDYGRCLDWHRLYNYAWMAQLFTEVYCLTGEPAYALRIAKLLHRFYGSGGDKFYPIGLDMPQICACLDRAGLTAEKDAALTSFARHAAQLLALGTDYPGQEVQYEQSIVQPAADLMMQAYALFGQEAYLESAREHLRLLGLFNGQQPDYHLNEVALRHWDGYWFGKNKLLGDTFPHYWSALTGQAYARYARLTGDAQYGERAERALRGPLSLFAPDGSASCAMVYPMTVNGRKAHTLDPWANDQDWALYYYLKWHDGLTTQ